MDNISIFDRKHLELLLEPFAPGMTAHITPIKYEVLTPDSFLFLFRTTDKANGYHYFVSLETDFQKSLEGALCTIEDWHGNKIIEFWPLSDEDKKPSNDFERFKSATTGPYFAMLAEVKPPTHKGYWAESVTIMPGDKIDEKIKDYSQKAQKNIRKALDEVLKNAIDPSVPFLDSIKAQKQNAVVDGVNQTNMIVSVYVQPDDGVELFYTYSSNVSKKE